VPALKGTDPTIIAYRQTPADHISALNPLYPFLFTNSGAIYAGVPH